MKKICIEIITVLSVNGDAFVNDYIFNWIFSKLNVNKSTPGFSKEQECEKKLWSLLSIEKVNDNMKLFYWKFYYHFIIFYLFKMSHFW